VHEKQWYLKDIVRELEHTYPDTDFHYHFDSTSIRPDGGILYIQGQPEDDLTYPILIAEVKNQGTNELRLKEGLPKQAKGNAIERLGKNLIGLRTALMRFGRTRLAGGSPAAWPGRSPGRLRRLENQRESCE